MWSAAVPAPADIAWRQTNTQSFKSKKKQLLSGMQCLTRHMYRKCHHQASHQSLAVG